MVSKSLLSLLIVVCTVTTTYVHGAVSEDQKRDIVVTHNKYRCMHGLGEDKFLKWSDCVAKPAQEHANKNTMGHAGDSYRRTGCAGPAGENIAWGYTQVKDVIKDWYDEYSKYYITNPQSKQALHFTALIWKDAGYIGCGISDKRFYVCNYRGDDSNSSCRTPNYSGCYSSQVQMLDKSKTETQCAAIALKHYEKSDSSDSDSDSSTNSSLILTSSIVLVSIMTTCIFQLF